MIKNKPPKIAEWMLSRAVDSSIRYSALGDFEEQFQLIADERSLIHARIWYSLQVIKSLPSFVADSFYWSLVMIRNYLVVALRNMFRQKVHSFINIFGLSLGIALSILIFMFVRSEFAYDTFHENGAKIYRVNQKISGHNGTRFLSATPLPLCNALEDNYPEISHATRLGSSSMVVKTGENAFNETVTFVDADFFEMFSFPIMTGNKQKPLISLTSMV